MAVDRYTKVVLTVLALALVVLALHSWPAPPRALPLLGVRAAEAETAQPQFEITIPKAWGKVVGYSPGNLLLEAPDGSLREVDIRGTPPEYPKVKVHARWN